MREAQYICRKQNSKWYWDSELMSYASKYCTALNFLRENLSSNTSTRFEAKLSTCCSKCQIGSQVLLSRSGFDFSLVF